MSKIAERVRSEHASGSTIKRTYLLRSHEIRPKERVTFGLLSVPVRTCKHTQIHLTDSSVFLVVLRCMVQLQHALVFEKEGSFSACLSVILTKFGY